MVAPEELSEMVGRVEQMIEPDTDAVHLLPTCATSWSRRKYSEFPSAGAVPLVLL